MRGEQKEKAAQNMINGLHEFGYIDDKEKRMLEYQLKAGDFEVFKKIRNFLIKVADEITK